MSDEWEKYNKDSRTVCKYGSKCYQKNPQHHSKFKHPPQNLKRKNNDSPPNNKRMKPDSKTQNQKPELLSDDNKPQNKDVDTSKTNATTSNEDTQLEVESVPEILLPSNVTFYNDIVDIKSTIKELFLVDMPTDFYKFYESLKEVPNFNQVLSSVNLELIGPFDLLLDKLPILGDKDLYLIHWRFFFDPPEFQSVLKIKGKSEYHIGYFRDSPDEMPVFLAANDSSKDCHITPIADNIFATIYLYLQKEKTRSPFSSVPCQKFMEKVKVWAEKHKFSLEPFDMKKRLHGIVTRSFNGVGINVPYNKKTKLGYRNLVENDATIKKICTKLKNAKSRTEKDIALSELQPVITYATIAVDECDFGTGLELGIDLFSTGIKDLEQCVLSALCSAYPLLNRSSFSTIIKTHMKYRRKGPNMSILSASDDNNK